MKIREARAEDFDGAMALYQELTSDKGTLAQGEQARTQWETILNYPGTTVLAADLDGRVVCLVTLHVLPNLTVGTRPYALIENVVTTSALHRKGIGKQVMQAAIDCAWAEDAYKVMLLTGKHRGAKAFYEKVGFNDDEKHGMIIRKT